VLPGEIADAEERCRGRRLESTLPGSRCGRARGSLARQNPSAAVACTCSPLAVVARARAAPGRAHAAGRGGGASRFRDALLELPRGRAMCRQVALLAPPRARARGARRPARAAAGPSCSGARRPLSAQEPLRSTLLILFCADMFEFRTSEPIRLGLVSIWGSMQARV
jgi:hypothetical protein